MTEGYPENQTDERLAQAEDDIKALVRVAAVLLDLLVDGGVASGSECEAALRKAGRRMGSDREVIDHLRRHMSARDRR